MAVPSIVNQSALVNNAAEPYNLTFDPGAASTLAVAYFGNNGDPWEIANTTYGGLDVALAFAPAGGHASGGRRTGIWRTPNIEGRANNTFTSRLGFSSHYSKLMSLSVGSFFVSEQAAFAASSGVMGGPTVDPDGEDLLCIIQAHSSFNQPDALNFIDTQAINGVTPTLLLQSQGTGAGSYKMWSVPLLAANGPNSGWAKSPNLGINQPLSIVVTTYAGVALGKRSQSLVIS